MQHILFDTDGVIVHSEMWSIEYARRLGITPEIMLPFFRGVFQECIIGNADLRAAIEPFLNKWKWEGTVDAFLNEWFHYENHMDFKLIEMIQKLRKSGIFCHIATNQEANRLAFLKQKMGFSEYFDSIFCSCEMGYKKPQKEFYTHILSRLKIADPSEVLYFDDTLENIESAHSLGTSAILYHSFEDLEKALAKEGWNL